MDGPKEGGRGGGHLALYTPQCWAYYFRSCCRCSVTQRSSGCFSLSGYMDPSHKYENDHKSGQEEKKRWLRGSLSLSLKFYPLYSIAIHTCVCVCVLSLSGKGFYPSRAKSFDLRVLKEGRACWITKQRGLLSNEDATFSVFGFEKKVK